MQKWALPVPRGGTAGPQTKVAVLLLPEGAAPVASSVTRLQPLGLVGVTKTGTAMAGTVRLAARIRPARNRLVIELLSSPFVKRVDVKPLLGMFGALGGASWP